MAKSAGTAGAGNQVVGKVFILHGTAKAVAPDGTERVLAPNSPIYANEQIITGSDGSVSIQFDGPPVTQLDLGRMTEIVIDEDVYSGVAPEAVTEAAAEADKIQEALLKGDGEIDLEATAAGGGAAGAGGGHPVVNFDLDGNEVTPGGGAETEGIITTGIGTLNGAIAEDTAPVGGIDVAAVDEDGLSEPFAGNLGGDGDHPAVDSFITGDLTYSFGDDGPAAVNPFVWSMDGLEAMGVESQGHELLYEVVDGGLTLNAYYLIEEKYEVNDIGEDGGGRVEVFSVTVTDVATGAYTFELYQPLDHAEAGTEDDIVYDFTYTLTDGDGSTGTGSLAMTIDDDTPIIGGSGEDVSTDATNGSGITTTLEVSAGDVITFSWSFDADDYTPFNDFGFVVINGEVTKLADISQVGSFNATGWATFTYTATEAGPLSIGFGVMNTGDSGVDSHLLIDKLAVNGEVVQSFESGDLTGWEDTGSVTVVTSHDEGGGTPTDGDYMVQLTSSSGVYEGALESFFGLPEGAMDAVSNTGLAESGYDTVMVEDEQMPDGNDEPDGGVASVNGTIVDNVNWGADGFGSATTFSVGEQTFDTGTTVYWDQYGNFLGMNVGEDSEQPAASLVVNSDGTYTYDLLDNMLLGQDEQGEQIDVLATVSITGVDGDGDPISVPLILNVQDDIPALMTTGEDDDMPVLMTTVGEDGPLYSSDTVTVEDEKMQGWLGRLATDEHDGGVASVNGTIVDNVNWGADGFDSATTFSVGEDTFDAGDTVYWNQYGSFLGTNAGEDSEQPAASLLVNSDGTYTYNLLDNMLLGQDEQGEQIDVLATVSITGEDGDGDNVDVIVNLQVQDDKPLCITLPDIIAVEDEKMPGGINEHDGGVAIVTGTIVNNAAWGADGFGEATTFSVGGEDFDAGDTVYWDQYGNFMGEDSEQPAASMLVNSDGTYTYTLIDNMLLGQGTQGEQINLLDTVTITGEDADGDNVDVNVYLKVQDDKPGTMVAEANAIVEDEQLHPTTDEPTDATPDHTDQVSGDVSDNGNWGADGFGAVTQIQVGGNTSVLVPSEGSVTVYFAQDGSYLGTSTDGAAANLLVNSDGTYTFTVTDNLLISSGQGELIDTLGTVKFTGVDGDGDKATVNLTLQVQDDVPTIDVSSAVTYTLDVTNYDETSAGYDNSFGYYIKGAGGIPTTGVVVWDNVKNFVNGSVEITGYTPDQVGFFIIPNGNNTNPDLAAGTEVTFVLDTSGNWQAVAGTTPLIGQGANVLFDVETLNSDGIDHVVDNSYPGNLNWEDLDGGGDNDYNDINIGVVWSSNLPVLTTQDAETIGEDFDTDSDSFANLFTLTSDMGADDGGTAPALSYSLSVTNTATALTSDGLAITLAMDGNDIVGSTDEGDIFRISVDADTGEVTLTQYAEIDHLPEDVDGVNDNSNIGLPDGLISLTATATIIDGDGDMASDSQTLDISGSFSFDDDVPTVSVNAAVMVDDDDVVGAGGNAGGSGDDAPAMTSGTLAHDFGADGAGSIDFASMHGTTGLVGTETVTYSWDADSNTLTAEGPRGDLFTVVIEPTTGAYTLTQVDNVLHEPPVVTDHITINTGNTVLATGIGAGGMVKITVDGPGTDYLNFNSQESGDGTAFGITSNDGGDGGRYNEINYLGEDNSEVMKFKFQNDDGQAADGKIATHATVDINVFYASEDMNGSSSGLANEVGSYSLWNNGHQVQGPTIFTANSTAGTFTLDINGPAGGFDEIRFSALQGTPHGNDPSWGDSSDYNVKQVTFDLMPEAYENNAGPVELIYTVTDGDGDSVNGTLNLTFDDDTPVAYNNEVTFNVNDNAYTDHITVNTLNTVLATGIGAGGMVKITVDGPGTDYLNFNSNESGDGTAFGITSNDGGDGGRYDEINYLGEDNPEVMRFELQNDDGQAADGKIATHATVDINVFFASEDMNGSSSGVANEVGSYSLWNNGHQVQGPTTFTANSTAGTFTLDINGPAGGFDEIRFSALQGTPHGNDPSWGDSSDYNVKQVTFDLVSENETGNLLTGSDPDGSFGADGGHVLSIAGAGTGNIDSTPDGAGVLTVEGQYGGMLTVESDGDYIYTPPAAGGSGSGEDVHEVFEFTLIDGDGDTSTAQLDMLIDAPDDDNGPC